MIGKRSLTSRGRGGEAPFPTRKDGPTGLLESAEGRVTFTALGDANHGRRTFAWPRGAVQEGPPR